jgi:PAS domain S-box-containing protein
MMVEPTDSFRILHVDDDPDFASMAADFLEAEDDRFSVETANSAREGLDRLEEKRFDCVVSDYEMPGKNGIEFLESVRTDAPNLPFVLYTGKGSEEVASDAISAGVTDYLQKETGTDQYTVLANRVANAVEHARSRELVQRSQQRLRDVIDTLPHALFVVDVDGHYLLANEALASFHGRTVEDMEGTHVSEVLGSSAAEQFIGDVRSVLEADSARRFDTVELQDPDGHRHIFESRVRPYDFGETETRTVLGIALDVTEREQREQELRRKERRYQAVFNDPNILVGLIDTDGTVVDINETAMEYVDASLEEIRGTPFGETPWFDHSEDARAAVDEWIERAAEGEYVEFETTLVRPSGEEYTIEGVFRPVTTDEGEVVSLLISDRDVTERKKRERELERYEAYLEESTDIITVLDEDGTIEYESPSATRILGYEPGELVGQDAFDFVHPDDRAELFETFSDLVARPGETVTAEYRFRTAEDEWCWLEVRGTNQLQHEAIGGIVTNNRDITDRKERERALQRERDRLEEFAGVVSHDLRNPLRVAEGRVELLREECESDHLQQIDQALDRMSSIIDDVLSLAKEGRDIRRLDPVDLRESVPTAWDLVSEGTEATLSGEWEGGSPVVEADPDRLRQLLENLFRNAIDHGGSAVEVRVETTASGFAIEDDGPGIPLEDRSTVFDVGHSSTQGGTGFGLSIVEQVAEAHGWDVSVTESDTGGARFEFTGVTTQPAEEH